MSSATSATGSVTRNTDPHQNACSRAPAISSPSAAHAAPAPDHSAMARVRPGPDHNAVIRARVVG